LIAELSDALTTAVTPTWSLLGTDHTLPPNCQTASILLGTHLYRVIVDISEMDGIKACGACTMFLLLEG